MKTNTFNARFTKTWLPCCIVAGFFAQPNTATAATETVLINSSTTATPADTMPSIAASNTTIYRIADGAVFEVTRAATTGNALFKAASNNATNTGLVIGPSGAEGTGRLLIQNISSTGNGTVFSAASNNTNTFLSITNADFKYNHATGFGAVIMINLLESQILLNSVLFEGNYTEAVAGGGAIRTSGFISITSGTFLGNFSAGVMGALGLQANGASAVLDRVHFESNRAGTHGGAISTVSAANRTINVSATNVTFTNNWANGNGGAIYSGISDGYSFNIHMTAAGGVNYYEYKGNFAAGSTGTASLADLAANTQPAASAAAGGFYYAYSTGTLAFDMDDGVTLAIGDASASNRNFDSIASAAATAKMLKSGSGTLVLNADNSYYLGSFAINQGSVILGNTGAKLGGAITVASGALLGGEGALTTAGLVSSLTVDSGAFVQIGSANAASQQTLTLEGNLIAHDGAIFRFDLFEGNISDQFFVNGAITQSNGASIIDVNALISGTYNLGNITGLSGAIFTVNGMEMAAGARQTGAFDTTTNPGFLTLITGADISRVLTWNATSGTWNTTADNWTDFGAVTKYAPGDRVIFANAANTTITLAGSGEFKVADMKVDGTANLIFEGASGITADPASVVSGNGSDPERVTDATGKLVKLGAGTLTFANTGTNTFKGGIELGGGMLAFSNASQINTTGASIRVTAGATLRANAAIASLANAIAIDGGQTLAFDTQAYNVTYAGALSSAGTFAKIGAGVLTLTGNSAAFAGATQINAGTLRLDNAQLGGAVSLAAGATLSGAGKAGTGAFSAAAGSTIDVGMDSAAPGTLAFGGALTLDSATIKMDLFGDQGGSFVSDQITAASLTLLNTSTITIGAFQTGTYTLGVIAGLDTVANFTTGLVLYIGDSGRQSGTLTIHDSNKLVLSTMADISRVLAWTGASSTWHGAGVGDWSGTSGVNEFASGDRVVFDNNASATNRAIAIVGAIHASDMIVSGSGYTFAGDGGITTGTRYVSASGAEFSGAISGKLIKLGADTLTFANTGGNLFEDGIQIGDANTTGGVIAFDNASQLRTGANAAIHFVNTGTLRMANPAVAGTLAANIAIDAGKTAALSTQGGTLTYSGALSGGTTATLAQGGATDTLILTGNSDAYAGITSVTGTMLLSGATLGGTVNVAPGALFGGAGSATGANSVHAANGATIHVGLPGDSGSETLAIANLQLANGATITGHGTLSGTAMIPAASTATADIASGKTITLAATVGGDGELVKTGPGTLNVTTGKLLGKTLSIQQGALRISGSAATINASTLNIAPAGVLCATGANTITAGTLNNAGSILVGRAAGDNAWGSLTINGNYNGGGSISLYIGNNGTNKDALNINGSISGVTDVTLTPNVTITAPANLPGNIITLYGGYGTIPEGAFNILGSGIVIGDDPFAYTYNPVTGRWFQADVPVPAVPAVTGLDAATVLIGKASLSSLSQRLAASRDNLMPLAPRTPQSAELYPLSTELTTARANPPPHTFQLWINGLYRHDKLNTTLYKNASNATSGVQVGADWTCSVNNTAAILTLGLFYDYASAGMDLNRNIASTDTKSNAAGVYLQAQGAAWYASAMFRGGGLDYTVSVPGKPSFATSGDTWAAALELGCSMTSGKGMNIEPQVQLVYQTSYMDDATDSQGLVYRANGTESLEARVGLRLWQQFRLKNGHLLTPYGRASYAYDFKGRSEMLVSDYRFANNLGGAAFMLDAGATMQLSCLISVNAGASWLYNGKVESYGFNLSAALAW